DITEKNGLQGNDAIRGYKVPSRVAFGGKDFLGRRAHEILIDGRQPPCLKIRYRLLACSLTCAEQLPGTAPRKFTTRKSRELHSVVESEIHELLVDECLSHLWKKRERRYRPWGDLNGRNLFGQELNNNAIGNRREWQQKPQFLRLFS